MTISYNWLCDYLPIKKTPEELSIILTSIGLEVESLEKFESFKGGLNGLIVGEVTSSKPHPNADKLKLTEVSIGSGSPLQIVCGAANVAAGQKVIVAPVGTTIFPINAEPILIKKAVIRSVASDGMLCAEDEIGLSDDHSGIIVLNENAVVGTSAAAYYNIYSDWIYEIGLTPNRTDAMSHIGVAKDVCAWISFHENVTKPVLPYINQSNNLHEKNPVKIIIEDVEGCKRYTGVTIKNVKVQASPFWLQNYLKAIGQRPINNIVDITNFILHETGQPLHAFDLNTIRGSQVIVKTLEDSTKFVTLDGIERQLTANDLMICDAEGPICIAGVFGGLGTGITNETTSVFLESAWFNPVYIRKTSLHHNLRTEAAIHFEKGVDISNAVNAVNRAALLIEEIAGGKIIADATDVYPIPAEKKRISFSYDFLKKLSGKEYSKQQVKTILASLDFEIAKEDNHFLEILVPFNKYDVSLPADIVEEIIRIDGIDNIPIPSAFTISPTLDEVSGKELFKEKLADLLTGLGFREIVTNSITNSLYYEEAVLSRSVRMINSLSSELDILKPSTLETGLETVAYNINRKNNNLLFFEYGKTYSQNGIGEYCEEEKLSFWLTGNISIKSWNSIDKVVDIYWFKGMLEAIFQNFFLTIDVGEPITAREGKKFLVTTQNLTIGYILEINKSYLKKFDINQPVLFAAIDYQEIFSQIGKNKIQFAEISKFPAIERDLSMILDNGISYVKIKSVINSICLPELIHFKLFDLFENEKLGQNKRSFALRFTFGNPQKTLIDEEVDASIQLIVKKLEKDLLAEIRTK